MTAAHRTGGRGMTLATTLLALGWAGLAPASRAQDGGVIFDMDTVRHKPTEITKEVNKAKVKIPAGSAELVDGKFGKAVKFDFADKSSGGFMVAGAKGSPEWDQAAGFSFWVKGDGSQSWGGIEVIDKSDFKLRYGYCFPIDSTDWVKVTVPWSDLVPELSAPPVDPKAVAPAAGYKPSGFGNFWFGKWFYWRDYPAHSYAIDQVMLEKTIDRPKVPEVEPALSRIKAKLKAGKPVTIVTMGDSLTDYRHWANRKNPWPEQLAAALKAKYRGEVTIVNPAIGGTTLSQNTVLIPRWAREAPAPDLVTICFGGNDWDSGVRGERFGQYLRLAVERIRRQTNGSADILVLTTCPGHARWQMYKELEAAAKAVAAEKQTGLADLAGAVRKLGSADEALKQKVWEWDKVHLGPRGHELVKDLVLGAVE